MFLAKYLDQKQGEARVVDRQVVVRERLEQWLKARPSAADLVERGVLGREERFAVARGVVEQFLHKRSQDREAQLARIPTGDFEYSDRLTQLLGGNAGEALAEPVGCVDSSALKDLLERLEGERQLLQSRLDASAEQWARAAEECQSAACGPTLPDADEGVGEALQLLESYSTTAGTSLKGVFEELHAFQRLTARRQCLETVVAVAEKTEVVREAVFKCAGAESLPLDTLEEVPALCRTLPTRSKRFGARRLRFVVDPLRTMLVQELEASLQVTGHWPRAVGQPLLPASSASAGSGARVIRLCAELQRVQRVHGETVELEPPEPDQQSPDVDADEGSWACAALAGPLVMRFRQLFCRAESDLCRLDKPEWAFRYLLENLLGEHGQILEGWLMSDDKALLPPAQAAALEGVDLLAGLALAMAREARTFVRARMPALVDDEEKSVLLHTLQHLVRFHAGIVAAGGPAAGAVAFADFDSNRPLHTEARERAGSAEEGRAASPDRRVDGGGPAEGLRGFRPPGRQAPERPTGFLDVWTAADAAFVADRLAAATGTATSSGARAWKPRRLRQGGVAGEGPEPEAAELATLLADLLKVAGSRAECLSTRAARATYCSRVLEKGVQQAVAAIRGQWNGMADPLAKEAQHAALLLETMEEICRFLDDFHLAQHFVQGVDETNALRLSMLQKLVESIVDAARKLLRRVDTESCVFSFALGPSLQALALRLRPSTFRVIAQRGVASLAQLLLQQLQRQAPFAGDRQLALYAANFGEDLREALAPLTASLEEADLAPLQPLWDSCALLLLPTAQAKAALEALQRVALVSPSSPEALAAAGATAGSLLRQKEMEVLAAAGVRELAANEAIGVLCKRPDLAAYVPKDLKFSMLQDLLPAGAAQSALQLGAGALQQLGDLSAQAPLPLPVASMAQATLQTGALGVAGLQGLAGGAGRRLAGRLRSSLAAAAAVGAGGP